MGNNEKDTQFDFNGKILKNCSSDVLPITQVLSLVAQKPRNFYNLPDVKFYNNEK